MAEVHIRRGHPIIFGLLTLFGVIEGSIAAWVVHSGDTAGYRSASVRDRSRFLLFVSWWTVLFSLLYIAFFQHSASTGSAITSIASHGIWLVLTFIFWTAGAASITAALGGGLNCSNPLNVHCSQLNALEGFAWVEWILMLFAVVMILILGARSIRAGDRFSGQLV